MNPLQNDVRRQGTNPSSAIREFNKGTIPVPAALVTQGVIVSV